MLTFKNKFEEDIFCEDFVSSLQHEFLKEKNPKLPELAGRMQVQFDGRLGFSKQNYLKDF